MAHGPGHHRHDATTPRAAANFQKAVSPDGRGPFLACGAFLGALLAWTSVTALDRANRRRATPLTARPKSRSTGRARDARR